MKKLSLTAIFILLFSNLFFGQNNRDSLFTKIGFPAEIKSEVLGDNVKIFIHLPFSYNPQKEYPLILLLDAHSSFKSFAGCTELMAYANTIPFSIVVGFPQYSYEPANKSEFEPKMEKLMAFCEKELMPYLLSKFNITKTIIWGQGLSGAMSTYFMLNKPGLFNGYISDMPDVSYLPEKTGSKTVFDDIRGKNISYYIFGKSTLPETNNSAAFLRNLQETAKDEFNWHYIVEDEPNMIIRVLTNYMHALELFLNEKK